MKKRKGCAGRLLRALLLLALLAVVAVLCGRAVQRCQRRQLAAQGLEIKPLYQYDYRKTVCCIGGVDKSVATSGCGAVCMSMVIDYLTGDAMQTPQTLFEEAYRNGDYNGYGLTHEALDRLALNHGVMGEWIDGSDAEIRRALAEGYPIIAHMGPGTFTREGHYILLRGVAENGDILVVDPNSESRTWSAWPLDDIRAQTKGSKPFMVCRKKA